MFHLTGFYVYDINLNEIIKPDYSLIAYYDIIFDSSGTVWIGSDDGLSEYRDDTLYNYSFVGKPEFNKVLSLNCDENGVIWSGTAGGLFSFNNGEKERYFPNPLDNRVQSIVVDKKDIIWCAHELDSYSTNLSYFKDNIWKIGPAEMGGSS